MTDETDAARYRCVADFHHAGPDHTGARVQRHVPVGQIVEAGDPVLTDRSVYFERVLSPAERRRRRDRRRLVYAGLGVAYLDVTNWGDGTPGGVNTWGQQLIGNFGLALCTALMVLMLVVLVMRGREVVSGRRPALPPPSRAPQLPSVAADDQLRNECLAAARRDVASALWWYREGCWDTAAVLGGVPTYMINGMMAAEVAEPAPPRLPTVATPDGKIDTSQIRTGKIMYLGAATEVIPYVPGEAAMPPGKAAAIRRKARHGGWVSASPTARPCPACGGPFTFAHAPVKATNTDDGQTSYVTGPVTASPSHRVLSGTHRWSCLRPNGTLRAVIRLHKAELIVEPMERPTTRDAARKRVLEIRDDMGTIVGLVDGSESLPPWASAWFTTLEHEFRAIERLALPAPERAETCTAPDVCQPVYDLPDEGGQLLGYVHATAYGRTLTFDHWHRRKQQP